MRTVESMEALPSLVGSSKPALLNSRRSSAKVLSDKIKHEIKKRSTSVEVVDKSDNLPTIAKNSVKQSRASRRAYKLSSR